MPRSSSARSPSSSDSSTAVMSWSSASSASSRVESCSAMRCSAVARSPTSPGAESAGRRCEIARRDRARDVAKLDDGLRDASREERRQRRVRRAARAGRSRARRAAPRARSRRVGASLSDTRTKPSGCCCATYSSSSPADALCRRAAPSPRERASTISGRVEMVLEPAPRLRSELRVADHDAQAVDQRDAVAERVAGAVRERVRIGARRATATR